MVDTDARRSVPASPRYPECTQGSQPRNDDEWAANAMNHATRIWRDTPEAQLVIGVRNIPRWKNEYLQRCIQRVLRATHPLEVENVPTPTYNTAPFQNVHKAGRKQLHSGGRTEPATPQWVYKAVDALVGILENNVGPSGQSQLYPQGYVSLDWLCARLPHRLRRQVVPLQLEKYMMENAKTVGSFSRLEFDPETRMVRLSRSWTPRSPSIAEQSDAKDQADVPYSEGSPRENLEYEPQVDSVAQDATESTTEVAVPDQTQPIQERVQGFTVYLDADLCLDFTQHTFDPRQQYLGPFYGQYEPSLKFVLDDPLARPNGNVTRVWDAKVCFNCLAPGHELNDCPLPWDSDRIDRNRDLQSSHAVVSAKDLRYYLLPEESSVQRCLEKFRPGKLSRALCEALGVNFEGGSQHEVTNATEEHSMGDTAVIPEYFERMYRFGYPPGYISTRPDRDPLYTAKTFIRPFTPLVIYGDDDMDVKQNTRKDTKVDGDQVEPEQPSSLPSTTSTNNGIPTTTKWYPLVVYPGLDLDRFDFSTKPPGLPKEQPAIWQEAPPSGAYPTAWTPGDEFSTLLSAYDTYSGQFSDASRRGGRNFPPSSRPRYHPYRHTTPHVPSYTPPSYPYSNPYTVDNIWNYPSFGTSHGQFSRSTEDKSEKYEHVSHRPEALASGKGSHPPTPSKPSLLPTDKPTTTTAPLGSNVLPSPLKEKPPTPPRHPQKDSQEDDDLEEGEIDMCLSD
ncbi:hypothetical protein IWQ62_000626 [Dispira parvispora]|uniref:CCHC-type domain-containing protein n=1 Tax=Dispira parvispora TaxID=1520584 RepID=A0A9W8AXZ7_9FUNG|nr:hypothetical protein IWQ62_000626 [Dispira parvispora]